MFIQVLFVYNTIDDFVMTNLKTYAGRPIKTAEAEDIDLGEDDAAKEGDESAAAAAAAGLSTEEGEDLCSWLKESALTDKVRGAGEAGARTLCPSACRLYCMAYVLKIHA